MRPKARPRAPASARAPGTACPAPRGSSRTALSPWRPASHPASSRAVWPSSPSRPRLFEPGQLLEEPVDLVERVVVHEPDPDGPAVLEPQPLHDLERVVVAVPDCEAALTEPACDLAGRQPVDGERERRHAP